MRICYKNNFGQAVDLTAWPYMVEESDLFDYEWSYEKRSGQNPGITRFYKDLIKKKVKVAVSAGDLDIYKVALEYLLEVTERDILAKHPGQLYVGEEYLQCYIYKSQKTEWHPGVAFLVNSFTVVSETGNWVKETTVSFNAQNVASLRGKRYPGRYPYSYANGMNSSYIVNPGYADANFRLIIYGPAVNPCVSIGGVSRQLYIVLEEGEYVEIDSAAGTVIKVMKYGAKVNAFHNRQKGKAFFSKIPPGQQIISFSPGINVDLTIYEERSEPKW